MSRFLDLAKVSATVELVITTKGDPLYTARLRALMPAIEANFDRVSGAAVRALPYMDAGYRTRIKALVKAVKPRIDAELAGNPFGVPVAMGSWAGSGEVAGFGINMYLMHEAFPDLIGPEYTLHALGLHARPSSSEQPVPGVDRRDAFEAERLWTQPRRLWLHSRRHGSGRADHQARFS
jgi:endoglucanase